MNEPMAILSAFAVCGEPVSCHRTGEGHINCTYLVSCSSGRRYILQRINTSVFKDPVGLMNNIQAVTSHIAAKIRDPRRVLHIVETRGGRLFYTSEDGSAWRVFDYVEGSLCLQAPESTADLYESAVAFGTFQQQLLDFPASQLSETIPNFHNTPDRYRIFRETVRRDPLGRASAVQAETEFVLRCEEKACRITKLLEQNELPLRVTHNDTKLNNVLLDARTRKALCVVDLDTVMPGSLLFDYGDAIRSGAATGREDDRDCESVSLRLDMFRAFTEGFLHACPGLTPLEKQLLPLGAYNMTLECGLRFLTDHIDGDRYFGASREGHNLDRCRTQFKLVSDMENNWQQMEDIVKELCL